MVTTIICAVIALLGTLGSGLISYAASKKQHDVTVALLKHRLDQLEKKMDLHNNAVVRLTQLEVRVDHLEH